MGILGVEYWNLGNGGDKILSELTINTIHYQWHSDRIEERPSELSYIIYLNDEFEGGKTCFFNDKLGVTPRKGSVLCFPVDDYHIHKSMKITSGTKQILWNCLWYEVPQDLNDVKKVTSKPVNKGNIWG